MKIGDEVYIHGYVDEIRKSTVIIRNEGGYFGTVEEEIIEKEDDLISRQAAIEATCADCSYANCRYRDNGVKHASCGYVDRLKRLPPVKPKPKIGRWIEKDGFDGDTYYDCSECGESFCLIDGTPTDYLYNYCPNCGAKMEGEE